MKSFDIWVDDGLTKRRVVLAGEGSVIYSHSSFAPLGMVITPDAEHWRRFRMLIQQCQDWGLIYEGPLMLDGTSWFVQAENEDGDLVVNSSGCNAFPENWGVLRLAIWELAWPVSRHYYY